MPRNTDKTNVRGWRGQSPRNPNERAEDRREPDDQVPMVEYIPRSDKHVDDQSRSDLENFHEYLDPWEARAGHEAW